ncbi:MAG: hypothetical protein ABUK20_12945 [Anaerolineales bacterium]
MDTALKAYLARWQAVEEVERQELQTATLELRWQQLNAVIGIAIGLGIFESADDETEVYQRWAILKDQHPTI